MKLLTMLLLLLAMAQSAFADELSRIGGFVGGAGQSHRPRHKPIQAVHVQDILGNPLRNLDGTVYNLGYLVKWDNDEARRDNNARFAGKYFRPSKRPLTGWTEYSGLIEKCIPFGLIFSVGQNNYCVTNFPGGSAQLVGRQVNFFAQVVGTYKDEWQRGIRLDYGVPVRPLRQAPPANKTNTLAKPL